MYTLVAIVCIYTGAFSKACTPTEIGDFPNRGECLKAAEQYKYDKPVCAIKKEVKLGVK